VAAVVAAVAEAAVAFLVVLFLGGIAGERRNGTTEVASK